nr:TraB domain-containing protein [Tanacetum cinerariifolium]
MFPERLQERFGKLHYHAADPPNFLNYERCEFLLISASDNIQEELGVDVHEDSSCSDLINTSVVCVAMELSYTLICKSDAQLLPSVITVMKSGLPFVLCSDLILRKPLTPRNSSQSKVTVACYKDLYKKLDSKEGANDIYKIAKARERRRRDIGYVRYIKDEGGRTIVREEDIRKRWGEHFCSFFNENPFDESRADVGRAVGSSSPHMHYECYCSRINQGEVKTTLKKIWRNKAVGPDQIPIGAWSWIRLLERGMYGLYSELGMIWCGRVQGRMGEEDEQ